MSKDPEKSVTLIVVGLGFLYFGWLFSATGIVTGRRGDFAVVASEDPERFSYAVGVVFVLGLASLVAGCVTMFRR
jgi:hypothetical protein